RDRFTLAVRVGREDHAVHGVGVAAQVLDDLALAADRHVLRLDAMLHVHAELSLRQVADMADRRLHAVALAKIFRDRPGLGRRLDDHEMRLVLTHSLFRSPGIRAAISSTMSAGERSSTSSTRSARR